MDVSIYVLVKVTKGIIIIFVFIACHLHQYSFLKTYFRITSQK